MRRSPIRSAFALLAVVLAASPSAWATCGPTQVCADASTSFNGQIVTEGVTVTWSTSHENSSVAYYKIKRYNCSTPNSCSVDVTTVMASGSCDQTQNYSYTDSPPSPVGSWTYTLEVWKSDGSRSCAIDVQPQ